MANEVLENSWTYLTVNFIIKLSLVVEKDAIFVIYDKLSKMTYFVTTTEKTSVERLARLYELLESMIFDRGSQFIAGLTRELS